MIQAEVGIGGNRRAVEAWWGYAQLFGWAYLMRCGAARELHELGTKIYIEENYLKIPK